MSPTLQALKAAVVLAATSAQNEAKILGATNAPRDRQHFHAGRSSAFQEVLRLIETVARLESEEIK